jgi:excisionase family DNA binding protein
MNTGRRPKTVEEFGESNNIGRSTVYKEKNSGRLKFTKVGRKSLIYPEDEDAWRASLPTPESKASTELVEQVAVAEDWHEVLEIASRFVKAIATLPARKREQLVERFNDLVAEQNSRSAEGRVRGATP